MNLLIDECVDRPIVEQLISDGHNVLYITDISKGISDERVLEIANKSRALLITLDKDFGELLFRKNLASSGILLLRLSGLPNQEKASRTSAAIKKHSEKLSNSFSVLSKKFIRIRNIYYVA